jgi:hypothetical protein
MATTPALIDLSALLDERGDGGPLGGGPRA